MTADDLLAISNPLLTPLQLASDLPSDLEQSLRYESALLTQSAGILLRLPQEIIAQAIVTVQRYYTSSSSYSHDSLKDFSAAALYLTAKLSFQPQTTRALLNVYAYLDSSASDQETRPDPLTYTLSEGAYLSARQDLLKNESSILRALSYNTHIVLPHTLALTYLQTLSLIPLAPTETSSALAKRTISHLNSALLSPQLLYLTHQPNALAVAAIYLAAREVGVKLPENQWWRVWDVGREELGFLVVGMGSLEGFASREVQTWDGKRVPRTAEEVKDELKNRERG